MNAQSNDSKYIVFDLNDFISIIKNKWKLMVIIYITVLSVTFIYKFTKKPVFKTSFIINNSINYPILKEIIENFNLLYAENGIKRNKFNQDSLPAHFSHFEKINIEDTELNTSFGTNLKLSLFTYDKTSIYSVIDELLKYCNSDEYFKELIENEKQKINKKIEENKKQLKELYLLKDVIKETSENNESMPLQIQQNQNTGLFKESFTNYLIHESLINLEFELKKLRGCFVIVKPLIPLNPEGISLKASLILVSILGLIFCPILIFFLNKILASTLSS